MQFEVKFPSGQTIVIPHVGMAADAPPGIAGAVRPVRPCVEGRDGKSPLTKAWSYATAVSKWVTAGSPTRNAAEIDRIFSICQSCEHFKNDKRPHCKLCGCSLSQAANGLVNKIAMATESCPATPPLWTADTTPAASGSSGDVQ